MFFQGDFGARIINYKNLITSKNNKRALTHAFLFIIKFYLLFNFSKNAQNQLHPHEKNCIGFDLAFVLVTKTLKYRQDF